MENFPEKNKPSEDLKSNKQLEYEKTLARLDLTADRLGKGLDPEIKDAVAYLRLFGFYTTGSCEGHTEKNLSFPYIHVGPISGSTEEYIGEEALITEITKKYGITELQFLKNQSLEAKNEYRREMEKIWESPQYLECKQKLKEASGRLDELLQDFYFDSQAKKEIRIVNNSLGSLTSRMESAIAKEGRLAKENLSADLIKQCQIEMKRFTEFLKGKYYAA